MLNDILYRLRALVLRRKVEREMAEELELHFQRELEKQLQTGVSPDQARRTARLHFGSVDQIEEACRTLLLLRGNSKAA